MLAANRVPAKRSASCHLLTSAPFIPCPQRRGLQRRPLLPCERRRRRTTPISAAKEPGKGTPSWGNDNRLAPGDQGRQWLPDSDSYLDSIDAANDEEPLPPTPWQRACSELFGRLQYDYFNWRQDTWSDLQLFMVLNVIVFLVGAWVRGTIIQELDHSALPPDGSDPLTAAWFSLYNVLSVVLGQDLPDADEAGWPSQLFAILTAIFGLASFALVLALIEQVVLEVLERNVKRGSACYESGHTVVMAWCDSARGIAQLTRILTQLCAANRVSGGGVVVVLTQQRGKLEMEELFRDVVPERNRLGTRFVFRQGSPLDPASLRMVAAMDAKAIIVSGDYSKRSKDADAQVLRACVLLDELLENAHPNFGSGPVVVAQIKTEDALPLVRYACSQRVIPVPTNKVNARRYVRLLHHPIAAVFSRCLSDFYSPAHGSIDYCPEIEGLTFGELHFRFPDAVLVGLANRYTNNYQLNPAPETRVLHGDEIICMRPYLQRDGDGRYSALPTTIPADPGAWDSEQYTLRSRDEQPLGLEVSDFDSCLAISARSPESKTDHSTRHPATPEKSKVDKPTSTKPKSKSKRSKQSKLAVRPSAEPYQGSSQGLYMLPVQYSDTLLAGDELLVCGWMGYTFMWELIGELDHSDQGLPFGSRVTLFNEHVWTTEYLQEQCARHGIVNLEVRHVCGDPRSRGDMERLLNIALFKGAIVVCDSFWTDAKASDTEGALQLLSQAEMLSLDSAMLMVQLNIRLLLEEAGRPSINILCEKLTYIGVTRFEDDARLPLGIAINSASFAAKTLAQVAMEPRFLQAYMLLGQESDLVVQDTSSFAAVGEELSFFQLQARASSVRQVVLGWYRIPTSMSQPLEMVVNPQGVEERSKVRVWNEGDSRCKLVTMAQVKLRGELKAAEEDQAEPFWPTTGSASADGGSVEDALPVWVAERVAAANVQDSEPVAAAKVQDSEPVAAAIVQDSEPVAAANVQGSDEATAAAAAADNQT